MLFAGCDDYPDVVPHPVNHVGWPVCKSVPGLVVGATLFFRERFDAGATLQLIKDKQLTLWLAFPSMVALARQSPQ